VSKQVLIVDDNPGNRKLLFFALGTCDYELYQASTGSEARSIIENSPLHLALLDVELPDANGLELAKEIRHRLPQAIIVILSVNDTNRAYDRAFEAGVNAYVIKPYNLRAVLELIRQLEEQPIEPHTNMLMLHNNAKKISRYRTAERQKIETLAEGEKHEDASSQNSVTGAD
jgi:DNA-binding response OmpR family regulator